MSQPAVPHPTASYSPPDGTSGGTIDPLTGVPVASESNRVVIDAAGLVGDHIDPYGASFAVDKDALGDLSKTWADAASELKTMLSDYAGLREVRPPADDPVSVTAARGFRALGERATQQLNRSLVECLRVGEPLEGASAMYGQADEEARRQFTEAKWWGAASSSLTNVTFTEYRPSLHALPWATTTLQPPVEDAAFNHQKIWQELQSGDRGQDMGMAQAAWASGLAQRLEKIQQQLDDATARGSAEWLGTAADSFRGAAHPFTQYLMDTQSVCQAVGHAMNQQLSLFNQTRNDMPEPVPTDLTKDMTLGAISSLFAGVPLRMEKEDQAVQAQARAREVYQTYRAESEAIMRSVPEFPESPSGPPAPPNTSTPPSAGTSRTVVAPPRKSAAASSVVPQSVSAEQPRPPVSTPNVNSAVSSSGDPTPAATTQQAASMVPSAPVAMATGSPAAALGPEGPEPSAGLLSGGEGRMQAWGKAPNLAARETGINRPGRGASAGVAEPAEERMASAGSSGRGSGAGSQVRPEQAAPQGGRADGEEDREHRRRYVADDDEHWGEDEPVTVPVIGNDDPEDYIYRGLGHEMHDDDISARAEQADFGLLEVDGAAPMSPTAPAMRELDNYLWGNDVG